VLKIDSPFTFSLTNGTESVITFFGTLEPNASISVSSDGSFNVTEIEIIGHKTSNQQIMLIVGSVTVIVAVIAICVFYYYLRRFKKA
jgi:hypothetical protein